MSIIAISGYAKSGKSQVAQYIQELQPHKNWKIKGYSQKLKEIAGLMTSIPADIFESQQGKQLQLPGWGMTVREFLQKLGTEAIRDNLHKDAWVMSLFSDYRNYDNWIITDCRFHNEADMVKNLGGTIVRVNRTGVHPLNFHPSETSMDDWDFDHIIENNGTLEDLKESSRILMTLT
jgi:hypothetical protein